MISGVHISPDMMGRMGRKGGYLVFILPLRWWEGWEGKGDIWCSYSPWDDGKNLKERGISGVHIAPEMMGRIGRKGGYLVFKWPLIWWEEWEGKGDIWCSYCPWDDGKDGKERGISGDYIAPDMMGRIGRKGGYLVIILPLIWWEGWGWSIEYISR